MGWFDLKDKIKRYYRFSPEEIKGLVIATLIIGFIVSFKDWGYEAFDAAIGLRNLLIALLMVGLSLLVQQTGHKIAGLSAGFTVEFRVWTYGLILGLVLILVSRGNLWFLAPGGIVIYHLTTHRLGYFRYGTNVWALGMVALAGPIANVLFGGLFKTLTIYFSWIPLNAALVDKLFILNMALAVYSLLPIPPLPGANLFFASRLWYAFLMGALATYLVLALLGVYSYVFALIGGIIIWLLFYSLFEKDWWKGT
ncbi:MAG TPA: hypothetical protein VJC16_01795 [Candidatus Nanoarchaeia archaeon]|nr:hypothetical protein [Candidatus Nanoarchaeia archaeon]